MDKLRQMERERGRLDAEPVSDRTGGQSFRPTCHQQTEQREPGFLSQRRQCGYRELFVHANQLYFNNCQINSAGAPCQGLKQSAPRPEFLSKLIESAPNCQRERDLELPPCESERRMCGG